uniref:30S ribosomal protein S6 n=1 Tax=Heterorhabditis bacteriophora TaxID=37862 RepID=A0A1I7WV66_HETBA
MSMYSLWVQVNSDQWHRDLKRAVKGLDLFEERGKGSSVPDFQQKGIYSTVGSLNLLIFFSIYRIVFYFKNHLLKTLIRKI